MGSDASAMRSSPPASCCDVNDSLHPSRFDRNANKSYSWPPSPTEQTGRRSNGFKLGIPSGKTLSRSPSRTKRGKRSIQSLPPIVLDRIISIVLAGAFEQGHLVYHRTLYQLKSVNRRIRTITSLQSLTNVYIATSTGLQRYETIISSDSPLPFEDIPTSECYDHRPLHPRDLAKSITVQIGGAQWNNVNERSILNYVTDNDCCRLLELEIRKSVTGGTVGMPALGRNLRTMRLEFRRGHPECLLGVLQGAGGWAEVNLKQLTCLIIHCCDREVCRDTHISSYLRQDRGGSGKSHPSSPTRTHTMPSLTHLTLQCTSNRLCLTLLSNTPQLRHLRLSGSYGALSSLPRQLHNSLRSLTLSVKNGKREYEAWNLGAALEAGLLRSHSTAPPSPAYASHVEAKGGRSSKYSHPSPTQELSDWGTKKDPSPKSTARVDSRGRSKGPDGLPSYSRSSKPKALSTKGLDSGDPQGTVYLEGCAILTPRWQADIQKVKEAGRKYGVRVQCDFDFEATAPPAYTDSY